MIKRTLHAEIEAGLNRQACIAILGPRQVGKTTLALECGKNRPSVYIDLEDPDQRAQLDEPALFFKHHQSKLVILDEIHRAPALFQTLRGVIDRGRRDGAGTGRFLVLGSASIDLLKQSGETLAGRIAYYELPPFTATEVLAAGHSVDLLWLRGGFPASFLAHSAAESAAWRKDFVRTYLEREVALFGGRLPTETLGRLWTMLAHRQGTLLNASELARSLGISAQSVTRYVDLLVDLLLVRKLPPYHANVSKRLVKSPKYYIRDSGLVHSLLGIHTVEALLGNPIIGLSWEGFAIEQLISSLPWNARPYFYRTAAGAEIDLLIEFSERDVWALEIKRRSTKTERGFFEACKDIQPTRKILVHGGDSSYPVQGGIDAMPLSMAMKILNEAGTHYV